MMRQVLKTLLKKMVKKGQGRLFGDSSMVSLMTPQERKET